MNIRTINDKKGFTLMELVAACAFTGLLAAATIPGILSITDKAREQVCITNRRTLILEYNTNLILNPDYTFDQLIHLHTDEILCPSGGIITAVDKAESIELICSIHNQAFPSE